MKRIYCRRAFLLFFHFQFSIFGFVGHLFARLTRDRQIDARSYVVKRSDFIVENEQMHLMTFPFASFRSHLRCCLTINFFLCVSNSPDGIPSSFRCYALQKIPRLHTSISWEIHSKPERWTNPFLINKCFFFFFMHFAVSFSQWHLNWRQ